MARAVALSFCSLAMANAFMMPGHAGVSLRSHSAGRSLNSMRRPRSACVAPKMQIEHLAEHATLLATAYPAGFVNGMTSYFNLFAPTLKGLNLPPVLLHWFHALNMGVVLVGMGGYGAYLGWNMRLNPSEKMALASGPNLGKSTSEMHKTLMTAMGVIFFLGANGGIVLALVQDKPITESVHFTTAMIGFALLATQGSITKAFAGGNAQVARTVHAFLGTATMGLFVFHASQVCHPHTQNLIYPHTNARTKCAQTNLRSALQVDFATRSKTICQCCSSGCTCVENAE